MDRRAIFFGVAASALLMLTPVAPREFTWLLLGLAGVYALLALASFADWKSARSARPRDQSDRDRS